MRVTKLFTKTQKEAPADEATKNAQLLIRAGFIDKEIAGVYSLLPLGFTVFNKIVGVIREELNAVGGVEFEMTALQNPEIWKKTNRWTDNEEVDVWFTTKLKNDTELGLGFTHEEPITNLMTKFISSYKDLPVLAHQFQKKFRNETRAKSGIMRTREFVMNDMYTFCVSEQQQLKQYERVKQAYINIFNRLGIGEKTLLTFASGGVFSKYSHEFQTLTDAGEDDIYICDRLNLAINKEVFNDAVLEDLGVSKDEVRVEKASEVGNIFNLGTKFSIPLNLNYVDERGKSQPVWMGSYGIGPARIMGVIVEVLSDSKGIVWPTNIAPASVYLAVLGDDADVVGEADKLYETLQEAGVEVLYDDRDVRPGEKFADADLIGIPHRVVVSAKTQAENKLEYKARTSEKAELISTDELLALVKSS